MPWNSLSRAQALTWAFPADLGLLDRCS